MSTPVKERIQKLREMMRRKKVAAFIIPSTDPHISEYVAPHWQAREWFSGFTGSAGTARHAGHHRLPASPPPSGRSRGH